MGSSSNRFMCALFSVVLLEEVLITLLVLSHKRSIRLYVALLINEAAMALDLSLHWRGPWGLSLVAETVGTIPSAIITAAAEGATNSFLKQYGMQ